ncbi:MAG: c-type cytochrome, partial [Thermoleophilia bacterium]|nr:c-type cytochrome [Thermoleophilia bacterium]
GQKGKGGNGGPDISMQSDAAHNIMQVTNGGGGMPAFGGQLSAEEIKAVADYVAGGLKG